PVVSNVNYVAGQTVPNLVTVELWPDGNICSASVAVEPRHAGAGGVRGGEEALDRHRAYPSDDREKGEDAAGAIALDDLGRHGEILDAPVGGGSQRYEGIERDPYGVVSSVADGTADGAPPAVVEEHRRVAVGDD